MGAFGCDILIGRVLLVTGVIFLLYYTVWTIVLPFLDPSLSIHLFFPDNIYAVSVPLGLVTLLVLVLALYANYLMRFG